VRKLIPKREQLIISLGGYVCIRCGFDDHRALQIDHIYGNKDFDLKNSGIMDYLLENPDIAYEELQILCANCNWIKRAENKEVRH